MIGDEIRTQRRAHQMTQNNLSKLSKIPQSRISEYESGARMPTPDALAAIATVLGPFSRGGQVLKVLELHAAQVELLDRFRCSQEDLAAASEVSQGKKKGDPEGPPSMPGSEGQSTPETTHTS